MQIGLDRLQTIVRALMLYGENNPVDGAVLRVILRKAEKIRKELGVAVPLPADNNKVVDAIMRAVLLHGAGISRVSQMTLPLDVTSVETELEDAWQTAQDKASRTVFAQRRLRPDDVLPEWRKTVSVLGGPDDVARFVRLSTERLGAPLDRHNGYSRLPVAHLPSPLQDRLNVFGFTSAAKIAFEQPAPAGAVYVHRAHPLVATLADYVAEQALDADMPEIGARAGAIFTRDIDSRTVLYLLRLRSQIQIEQRDEYGEFAPLKSMLAEECLGVAVNGSAAPQPLTQDAALSLLQLEPGRNMHDGQKSLLIRQTLDSISDLDDTFSRLARERARELLDGPPAYPRGKRRQRVALLRYPGTCPSIRLVFTYSCRWRISEVTMARTRRSHGFTALKVEGGILPPDFLQTIAELGAPRQASSDYGISKSLAIKEELARYWRIASDLYAAYVERWSP